MTSDDARTPAPDDDLSVTVAGLQDQIDDLTAILETHQRLFETLRAAGLLPAAAATEPAHD